MGVTLSIRSPTIKGKTGQCQHADLPAGAPTDVMQRQHQWQKEGEGPTVEQHGQRAATGRDPRIQRDGGSGNKLFPGKNTVAPGQQYL